MSFVELISDTICACIYIALVVVDVGLVGTLFSSMHFINTREYLYSDISVSARLYLYTDK